MRYHYLMKIIEWGCAITATKWLARIVAQAHFDLVLA
jgi:hypothetical protein